jgi:hypothetical protein
MEMGKYSLYSSQANQNGMTGAAAEFTALLAAVAMPSYSTSYYGTSGFDGNTQTYPFTPYPDHAVTWKAALFDNNTTLYSFPNQVLKFGMDEMITTQAQTRSDSRICPAGSFTNRPGYYGILLMGHLFHAVANVMKIRLDYSYANLEKSFDYANKGTMYSLQINAAGDELPYYYPQAMLVNEHFPAIAQGAWDYLTSQGTGDNGFGNQLYLTDPLGMVWMHDDWQNYVSAVNNKPATGEMPIVSIYPNPVVSSIFLTVPASLQPGMFRVFTTTGRVAAMAPVLTGETNFTYNTAALTNGMYVYVLDKGTKKVTGTFIIAR